MPFVCGGSDVRGPSNRGNCAGLDLRDVVAEIFRRSSAQHGQAAEDSSEKEAACGCSGMPWFMLVHGDCSGVTTALKNNVPNGTDGTNGTNGRAKA